MKTYYSLLLAFVVAFSVSAQKKQLKTAQKLVDAASFDAALTLLDDNSDLLRSAEPKYAAHYHYLLGAVQQAGKEFFKAVEAFDTSKSIEAKGGLTKYTQLINDSKASFINDIINQAVDLNSKGNYNEASKLLYLAYELDDENLDYLFGFLSKPSFALFVGVILSFRLIKFNPEIRLNFCIKNGLYSALPIVLTTGMGGTLGLIMQKIPIEDFINIYSFDFSLVLLIPFFISSIFKTVQGSSTVAIITTSTIIYPLLASLGLDNEIDKVWTILSIGVGSMTVSHTNDSYFWIVSEMTGISAKKALKYHTTGTLIQGIAGIVLILVGYKLTSLVNFI